MRRPRRLGLFAMILGTLVLPRGGWGADPAPTTLFGWGKQSLGISAGYGFAVPAGETTGELADVEYVYVVPRWSIGLSDPLGGDAWYRGNVELVAEGALLFAVEPDDGFAGGITAMVRYNFLPAGRLIPFVQGGAGILFLDLNLEDAGRADDFSFSPQAGVGIHYFFSGRTAFTGEWRWHHISNANIDEPNRGINSSLFLVGVTTFLK